MILNYKLLGNKKKGLYRSSAVLLFVWRVVLNVAMDSDSCCTLCMSAYFGWSTMKIFQHS